MTPPASPGLEPALEPPLEPSALVGAPRARLSGGAVLVACITWAPVGLSAALLVHIALLGLAPALVESHRLERAHEDQRARLAAARAEAAELGALQRALHDPIYLERERQALRVSPEGALAVPAAPKVPNSGLVPSEALATENAAPLTGAAH